MRIYSWNVNGLRACARKGFADWLHAAQADVVGVQELRATPEQLPADVRNPDGFDTWFHPAERPGYSGVALFSRLPFATEDGALDLPELDAEGRLQFARFGDLTLVNGYFPNGSGKNRDNSRIPAKLEFYDRLLARLQPRLEAGEPVLVMGDWNTAFAEIDLARPRDNTKTSGFCPEEREALGRWFEAGWVDTFRHFEPGGGHYTWWSNRPGVRARNVGWRIDYVLASPGAMRFVRGAAIHPDVMGSDHCPISVELDPAVVGS